VLVAVVSDTHLPRGARRLPEACLERLRTADAIIHAGDLVTAAVLRDLAALGPPLHAVAGNVDEPGLQALLPEELVVELGGVRFAVVHDAGPAAGREARLRSRFPTAGAIVYGHTHLPQVERSQGVWILNPGSPTERRRAPARTMLSVRVEAGELVPELVAVGT
jgi:uncharacterized protein